MKQIDIKKYSLFVSVLFLCLLVRGQDTTTYKFIDEYRISYHGEENERTVLLFGKSFSYQRIYGKDSIFKEAPGLLYDGRPYEFKIFGDRWFIKKTGKWQLFYSPNTYIIPPIKIYFSNKESWYFNFKAVRTDTLFGYHCIIYEMEPIPKVIRKSKNKIITRGLYVALPRYWFNQELGIIKIEADETNYIREDIIPADIDWYH